MSGRSEITPVKMRKDFHNWHVSRFVLGNTSSITDLLYYKDSLFWSEYKTNTIWKLKVSGEIGRWPREPEIFFTLQDGDIYALTLDRASG